MIWAFPVPSPSPPCPHLPTSLLLSSLSSALSVFPVLCASLHEDSRGAASLHLDNLNPVTFTEATHPLRLIDCIPPPSLRYGPSLSSLSGPSVVDYSRLPTDLCSPVRGDWKGTSCAVRVTRLGCGGVLLGLSAFHCLMDAAAVGAFLCEWGRRCGALKGGLTETSIPPIAHPPSFDRQFLVEGMKAALEAAPVTDNIFRIRLEGPAATTAENSPSPSSPDPPHVIGRVYHFPRAELESIRRAATVGCSSPDLSVHDSLFAHLMRTIARATDTVDSSEVMVCQAVNGRRVFGQGEFFGSCAFWLHHRTTYTSILSSLPLTAAAVHATHSTPDRTALLAYNGYLDSAPAYSNIQLTARITTHDFHVASWRHSGMYDVDFGDGPCSFCGPSQGRFTRYVIFLDTPRGSAGEGGVDVCLALEDKHWEAMRQQGHLHEYRSADHVDT